MEVPRTQFEKRGRDASDVMHGLGMLLSTSYDGPQAAEKGHLRGGEQFLESPPACEPSALSEGRRQLAREIPPNGTAPRDCVLVLDNGDVEEIGVADERVPVPLEHGVDGLRQHKATCLVDTACVDPCPQQPIFACLPASELDLEKSLLGDDSLVEGEDAGFRRLVRDEIAPLDVLHVLERHLLIAPSMR